MTRRDRGRGRDQVAGVVPTGFVVADHGGVVLLLNQGESVVDVSRLDLTTRRITPWNALGLGRRSGPGTCPG